MFYNVYKVEKISDCRKKADLLNFDYTSYFEYLKKVRGYTTLDYVVTDSEFELGCVYFNGDLIKPIEKVASFEGERPQVIFAGEKRQGEH